LHSIYNPLPGKIRYKKNREEKETLFPAQTDRTRPETSSMQDSIRAALKFYTAAIAFFVSPV
jgi:hypothetical protein